MMVRKGIMIKRINWMFTSLICVRRLRLRVIVYPWDVAPELRNLFYSWNDERSKVIFYCSIRDKWSNFATPFLKHLSPGLDFMWCYLPPSGRSGGILVGINMETTSIQRVEIGDFCVRLLVKSKSHGFEWILPGVYGAAQDALKIRLPCGVG
jgi:hypothetical protein